MQTDETIAVLGAGGTMGRPMARNLARGGMRVRAWNRTQAKAEPLAADGVEVVGTAEEAVRGATIVLTMLRDADAVLEAVDGTALGEAELWLQMSTIGLDGTARCQRLAEQEGVTFVDAPVLGTKQPAEDGALVVLASGPDAARERAQAVFDLVGSRTSWAGEAGAGSRLKLACNSWLLAVVAGAAEALTLAEGLGLDGAMVLDAFAGGPLDMPYLQTKGKAMLERDFPPAFALALAAKDAGLVVDAARQGGIEMPVLAAVRARLDAGVEAHGEDDMAATFLTTAAPTPPAGTG
jgi:3-hydroxyisobutyrate dehydrogenase